MHSFGLQAVHTKEFIKDSVRDVVDAGDVGLYWMLCCSGSAMNVMKGGDYDRHSDTAAFVLPWMVAQRVINLRVLPSPSNNTAVTTTEVV